MSEKEIEQERVSQRARIAREPEEPERARESQK